MIGKKASQEIQEQMGKPQGSSSQQSNNGSIASYLAPMPQTKDVNMRKK